MKARLLAVVALGLSLASPIAPGPARGADTPAPDSTSPGDAGRAPVVRNGGMTQGLSVPAEWNGKFGDCEVARDAAVFKVGPASLRVEVAGGKSGQAFQSFDARGVGKFTLAGWVRSAGSVKVNVAVQSFDEKVTRNDFQQVKFVQGDTDWTEFRREVTLPPWAASFHVLILAEGDGKAWLDEVHEASAPVDPGHAVDSLTSEPPPRGRPWEPGWGFYPRFPAAWQSAHQSLLERTKKGSVGVIFFGDSITQGWNDDGKRVWEMNYAPLNAADYGIGGDSTRQVLWRLEHGEVEGLSPRVAVVMIGTNNLYGDHNAGSDEEIARGVGAVVQSLRQKLPRTRVLLLGVLPRQNEYFSGRVKNVNGLIAKFDDGKDVRYLDMGEKFQNAFGRVKPELFHDDQLHLVDRGYEVWADAMRPLLDEMLEP